MFVADRRQNTIAWTFSLARCGKARYAAGVACAAAGTLCTVVPFVAVAAMVADMLGALESADPLDGGMVLFWTGVTAASIVAGLAFSVAGSSLAHASAFEALYALRMRVLEHMGKLPLGFFTGGRAGAVQKMMDANIEKMESIIAHDVPNIAGAAVSLAALAVLLFSTNVVLAIVLFAALAAAFAIQFTAFGGKRGQRNWANINRAQTDLDAGFSEYVAGMQEEKIFGGSRAACARLARVIDQTRDYYAVYLKRVTPIFGAFKTVTLSVLSFVLIAGAVLIAGDPGDAGLITDVVVFVVVGSAVVNPLLELVELGSELNNLAHKLGEIEDVLDERPLPCPPSSTPRTGAEVAFADVTFSYQPASDPLRRLALDHVSFVAQEGKLTALVGPSGSGKSTVGQLVARFWDVEGGSVRIGGVDVRDMTADDLMSTVAFVFQDTYLFAQSAYDNIRMGSPATREQVEAAARAARCHDVLSALPQGYGTLLGDGGHRLSGGEAQRVAIARAILKDAPIVVLDEAMAFADAENELALREAMDELLAGRTVIMIAHRLYSICDADSIVVMDGGRVIEQGTHESLMAAEGLYSHLWRVQNESDQWSLHEGVSFGRTAAGAPPEGALPERASRVGSAGRSRTTGEGSLYE